MEQDSFSYYIYTDDLNGDYKIFEHVINFQNEDY